MWSEVSSIKEIYEEYDMAEMICPSPTANFTIDDLQSDTKSESIYIRVEAEKFNTSDPNASNFINSYVAQHRYFTINFYMLNTGFNLGNKDSIFKYIDDSPWITFNDQIGTEVVV